MRGERQGMSMLCCTGFGMRMGRDYHGAFSAASNQLWSGNRNLQRPGLPLPAAWGLPPQHSLFVTQKSKISSLISRREDNNNFAGYVFLNPRLGKSQ